MTDEINPDIEMLQARALAAHLDREAVYERKLHAEEWLREIDATLKSIIYLLLCEECRAHVSKRRDDAIRQLHRLEHEEHVAIAALVKAKDALGERLTTEELKSAYGIE